MKSPGPKERDEKVPSKVIPKALVAAGVLALAVGMVSLRYALPSQPAAAPIPNARLNPVPLAIHAVSGALALIIMPLQLRSSLRARHPRLHRIAGRTYAALVVVAASSAIVIAPSAVGGFVSTAGFLGLAASWLVTTGAGVREALARRHDRHRAWMVRSSALTFSAVTLRLFIPLATRAMGFDFVSSYRAIAWLCWVPNLLVAEWWLRRKPQMPAVGASKAPYVRT